MGIPYQRYGTSPPTRHQMGRQKLLDKQITLNTSAIVGYVMYSSTLNIKMSEGPVDELIGLTKLNLTEDAATAGDITDADAALATAAGDAAEGKVDTMLQCLNKLVIYPGASRSTRSDILYVTSQSKVHCASVTRV